MRIWWRWGAPYADVCKCPGTRRGSATARQSLAWSSTQCRGLTSDSLGRGGRSRRRSSRSSVPQIPPGDLEFSGALCPTFPIPVFFDVCCLLFFIDKSSCSLNTMDCLVNVLLCRCVYSIIHAEIHFFLFSWSLIYKFLVRRRRSAIPRFAKLLGPAFFLGWLFFLHCQVVWNNICDLPLFQVENVKSKIEI